MWLAHVAAEEASAPYWLLAGGFSSSPGWLFHEVPCVLMTWQLASPERVMLAEVGWKLCFL